MSPRVKDRSERCCYYRDGGLFAQQFDTEHAVLLGEPIPVLEHVGYIAASIRAEFEASLDGSLIVSRRTDGDDNLLTWFNRKGEATGTLGAPDSYHQPRIAPNGALVAFNRPTRRMATVISGTPKSLGERLPG